MFFRKFNFAHILDVCKNSFRKNKASLKVNDDAVVLPSAESHRDAEKVEMQSESAAISRLVNRPETSGSSNVSPLKTSFDFAECYNNSMAGLNSTFGENHSKAPRIPKTSRSKKRPVKGIDLKINLYYS